MNHSSAKLDRYEDGASGGRMRMSAVSSGRLTQLSEAPGLSSNRLQ